MDRPAEALAVLKMVMAKDPENEWAHITQGLFYQRGNRPEQSLHHFREAARINPENTMVHKCIKQLQERPVEWSGGVMALFFLIYLIYKFGGILFPHH